MIDPQHIPAIVCYKLKEIIIIFFSKKIFIWLKYQKLE